MIRIQILVFVLIFVLAWVFSIPWLLSLAWGIWNNFWLVDAALTFGGDALKLLKRFRITK